MSGSPDGQVKNIAVLFDSFGARGVAPLYDLATGLAYEQDRVDRSVAHRAVDAVDHNCDVVLQGL